MSGAIKRSEAVGVDIDAATTARVVESLVVRGDISALSPEERARFYVQMCSSLGLSAASQPFAILRLNGKEILYPTRGATDQLAAIHRLNREIVDGPKVIDVAGTKLVYAVCRASHPNGRVETATAMVPLPAGADNICNAFLKTETKARRRATLSILGLGLLDETEIETIPAAAKSPGTPIDLDRAASIEHPAIEHPALDVLRDKLAESGTVGTLEAALGAYGDVRDATGDDAVLGIAKAACIEHLEKVVGLKAVRSAFQKAINEAESARARAQREALAAELLRAIQQAPSGKALLGLAPRVDATTGDARGLAVECYCDAWARVINAAPAVETLGAIGKALAGLAGKLGEEVRAGTAEAMARRTAELVPPDSTPPKGRKRAANDAPADEERAAIAAEPSGAAQAEARWRAHLAAKTHAFEAANSLAKHEHDAEYRALGTDAMVRLAIARMVALSAGTEHAMGEMTSLNAIKVARAERARKLATRRAA